MSANDVKLGWVEIRTDPEMHQATCGQCGWHTVPLLNRNRVQTYALMHEADCPRPYPPRNGALMECGCWWYGYAGAAAGETRAECPLHGNRLMVKANVAGPRPPDTRSWIPDFAPGEHEESRP